MRRHRAGLAGAEGARSYHQIGLAVQQRPEDARQIGRIVGGVAVEQHDDLGVNGRADAGPAGVAVAAPGLRDDRGAAGPAMAAVSSVEPLSTTTTSVSGTAR